MARARARKKPIEADPVEPPPVEPTEDLAQVTDLGSQPADSTEFDPVKIEKESQAATHAEQNPPRAAHIANPSSVRRESHAATVGRRLPAKLTLTAGDLKVNLIDKGDNLAGIGIQVSMPEGRALTDDEKAIIRRHIKGEEGENTGFVWVGAVGMWHRAIVLENEFEDQIPPMRPVAIRFDAERRVEKLADALRQHSADPVGYAEMVRAQREQAANADRIPD